MNQTIRSTNLVAELLNYLFEGKSHLLTLPMKTWLGSSRRFAAFVNTYRDKIRKKLRVTQDRETLYDLQLELETAFLLLQERTLSVIYEPEQNRQVRSPDFAVTFTTSLTFMVEVTRLRGGAMPISDHGLAPGDERLADAICSKLGQLLPQRSNILMIGVGTLLLSHKDLQNLMLRIQQRAEARDSVLWQRYGFRDRADFIRHYQRLSEVFVRGSQLRPQEPGVTWVNSQAKYSLPSKVRTVLYRSLSV